MCFLLLWSIGLGPICSLQVSQEAAPAVQETPLTVLKREAQALSPLVTSRLAKEFLNQTPNLPEASPRTVYLDETKKTYTSEADANTLSQADKNKLKRIKLDASYYWNTKYGSPLAYARPLEVLGSAGLETVTGKKILDFGYGTIGHLRLLATQGARVTGVDVDSLLLALYSSPLDQGLVKNTNGQDGQLRLIDGRFPADETTRAAVGSDYDLIISKNTLKRGYVHPEEPVEPRRLLNLGVDDTTFVRTFYRALKPGGRVLIYNLSPAPSPKGQPYKNWADGRCPFARAEWERAGFHVLAFDHDDSEPARTMGHALGWDQGPSSIDLKSDLFARYSLMEKPKEN
jgi:SAM-dependent methyltransferase